MCVQPGYVVVCEPGSTVVTYFTVQRVLSVTVAKDVHHQDMSAGSSSVESLYTKSSLYSIIPGDVYWALCQASRSPKYFYLSPAGREEKHLISRPWGMVPRSLNHHLLPLSVSGSNLQGAGRQMGHTRRIADDTWGCIRVLNRH